MKSRKVNQLAPLGTLIEVTGVVGNQPVGVYGIYSAQPPNRMKSGRSTGRQRTKTQHKAYRSANTSKPSAVTSPPRALLQRGSLHAKVQAQLTPDDGSVHDHLRGTLLESLATCAVDGRTFIVGGDFNSSLTPGVDVHDFMGVIDGMKMANSETPFQRKRYTYMSSSAKTRIDHMFHSSGATCSGCRLVRSVHHRHGHAGMVAGYEVNRGPPSRWQFILRQLQTVKKDFSDPATVAEITAKFKALRRELTLGCAERLERLTEDTVALVYPKRKRSMKTRICRDWSPDSVALEIHLKRAYKIEKLFNSKRAGSPRALSKLVQYDGIKSLAGVPGAKSSVFTSSRSLSTTP